MAGAVNVHVSFDQQELVQFKHQVQHGFAVLGNTLYIEQQKTNELILLQPLIKERISEIQIIVGKCMSENEKLKNSTESLKEEAEQEINTLKAWAAHVLEILNGLKLQMESWDLKLAETSETGLRLQDENLKLKKKNEKQDVAMKRLEQEINALKAGTNESLRMLDQQIKSSNMRLAETDLRFEVLEINNGGILIWKIQDFSQRKEDAKQDGTLFINSQHFYTSKYGYKMRLCICLNADGIGEINDISLYLVVMKGEYDALLPFPFQNKVTLSLLEHGSEERALTPDPFSFMKPISEMSIASGFPMFVSHDQLKHGNYVKDDTIIVKAVIEGKLIGSYYAK